MGYNFDIHILSETKDRGKSRFCCCFTKMPYLSNHKYPKAENRNQLKLHSQRKLDKLLMSISCQKPKIGAKVVFALAVSQNLTHLKPQILQGK
jgi:hypothetical protein